MELSTLKRAGVIVMSILCSFFIADLLTNALIRAVGLSAGSGAVAGLIVFGILFFSILQLIEKLTGTGIFRFGPG
jgi:hypothetical protein